jgi:hypothetical protein
MTVDIISNTTTEFYVEQDLGWTNMERTEIAWHIWCI